MKPNFDRIKRVAQAIKGYYAGPWQRSTLVLQPEQNRRMNDDDFRKAQAYERRVIRGPGRIGSPECNPVFVIEHALELDEITAYLAEVSPVVTLSLIEYIKELEARLMQLQSPTEKPDLPDGTRMLFAHLYYENEYIGKGLVPESSPVETGADRISEFRITITKIHFFRRSLSTLFSISGEANRQLTIAIPSTHTRYTGFVEKAEGVVELDETLAADSIIVNVDPRATTTYSGPLTNFPAS